MPTPHQGSPNPTLFGAGDLWSDSVVHQQGGVVSKILNDEVCTLYRVSNLGIAYTQGDPPARCQQRVGGLPVAESPGPNRMAPQSADSTASVSGVGQASSGPVRLPPKPPTPPLVLSDRSLAGGGLQRPVPVMDGAVPLHLPSHPSLVERTPIRIREDHAGEAIVLTLCLPRRSWYHLLQMACEIHLLLPCRRDLLSQHLPSKGILYHTDLETLQLMGWELSGKPSRTRDLLKSLSEQSSQPTVTPLKGVQ